MGRNVTPMTEKTHLLGSESETKINFLTERKISKQTWIILGLCFAFVIILIIFAVFGVVIYIIIPKTPKITFQETRKMGFGFHPGNMTISATVIALNLPLETIFRSEFSYC